MKQIPLTQGKYAKVDDEDYDELVKYKWCISKKRSGDYVVRNNDYPRYLIYMHREIMKPTPGKVVHHINGDTLDDQKTNLQIVDDSYNGMKRNKLNKNNTSGYRGVTIGRDPGKWQAEVTYQGKHRGLGTYSTPEAASEAVENFLNSNVLP